MPKLGDIALRESRALKGFEPQKVDGS